MSIAVSAVERSTKIKKQSFLGFFVGKQRKDILRNIILSVHKIQSGKWELGTVPRKSRKVFGLEKPTSKVRN